MLSRNIEINADLVLSVGHTQIAVKASQNKVTILFQRIALGQICRQFLILDHLQLLDRFWNFSHEAQLRVYLQYGLLKFRMPRPALCRIFIRLFGAFGRKSTIKAA